MESNLFIELSSDEQEVVAGGFVFDTNSFFNAGATSSTTGLAFLGGSQSTAAGTTTTAGFQYSNVDVSQFLLNGGGTKITQPLTV